jgi:hypothetical protein
MRKRGYLDLTPGELQARRLIFRGGALFVIPPLLSLCHMQQFACQVSWESGVASLVAMTPLFPWLLLVAALMLAGFATTTLGTVLFLHEKYRFARCCPSRPNPSKLRGDSHVTEISGGIRDHAFAATWYDHGIRRVTGTGICSR